MFLQNLAFTLRQLRRNPGFAVAVIVTLALAIGANTAIFSIVNALMVRSLPYPQPERLGTIFRTVHGGEPYDGAHGISGEQWELLRDNVPSLTAAVSSPGTNGVNLEAGRHVDYVQAGRISAQYLDVLGIHPLLGRNFSETEDRPQGPKSVILSFALWHGIFNEDRKLLGQTIHLKGDSYTVIGILPNKATTPLNADLYTALQPSRSGEGGGTNYEVITRLRDGATWQQADAEINRAWAGWAAGLAKQIGHDAHVSFYCLPLKKGEAAALSSKALTLMFASGFILLIACANLAGLTLLRIARRTPEIATRLALGASRWQLQKQLWIENLLLAGMGGLAGLEVGNLALHGLLSLLPKDFLPVAGVPLDGTVLAFTMVVSLSTSVLFGMLPTFIVRKIDLRSSMATRAVAGSERLRLRQGLIAGEVALTVVLLAGSGLLIRTLIHLETLPPGFNPNGVMTAKASLDDARYHDPAAFAQLLDQSTAAMRRIPGVENAAVGLTLPFEFTMNDQVRLNNGPQAGQTVGTDLDYVTPGYFETLEMPLLAGRTFTSSDGPKAQSVAVVNRSFARKFFPGVNPVGHTVDNGTQIVGVVEDIQISSGLNPVAPLQSEETMYIPAAQIVDPKMLALVHTWFQPSWIVRTAGPIEGLTGQMQRALASVDPGLPFSGFYAMSDLQAQTLATQRIEVALMGTMAGLALLLSAIGIFALVSNMVTQRTREIGIRMALGSTVNQAMVNVSATGVRASAIGLAGGLGLCFAVLRIMRNVLYGVGVYDAPTLIFTSLALAAIILLASVVPALRVARVDPATTLREE
ncbi:MAG TPA: ABC transporter permease [Terracidiphilus sp.]|nr:ABC transporter permease [Terracidiphilus sp.]